MAALLAATILVPASVLSADSDSKSSTDRAITEKSAADKKAGGKSPAGKQGSAKADAAKAAGDKAAPVKADAGTADTQAATPAKADAGQTAAGQSNQEQVGGGKTTAPTVAVAAAGAAGAVAAAPAGSQVDYTRLTPAELAEYLIFQAKGFKLDQPTQEGKTGKDRMTQDELLKTCSALRGRPVDPETAKKVQELAVASRVYPQGGIVLGDWKKGEALAKEGAGFRLPPKLDDNKKLGGNCYACHQMDLGFSGHGTLGPSLTAFGKNRGNTPETQKYVYEVIYNGHAYFPCTNMPRFGANGFLNQEQIADLMAYLLAPESPVNH